MPFSSTGGIIEPWQQVGAKLSPSEQQPIDCSCMPTEEMPLQWKLHGLRLWCPHVLRPNADATGGTRDRQTQTLNLGATCAFIVAGGKCTTTTLDCERLGKMPTPRIMRNTTTRVRPVSWAAPSSLFCSSICARQSIGPQPDSAPQHQPTCIQRH